MTKLRWLLLLLGCASLGCGNDAHQGLSYLPVREAEEQNAPNPRGDCPQAWKDREVSPDWVLRTGSESAELNAATLDRCGNIYVGWTANQAGHVEKFFPSGGLAWERTWSTSARSSIDSITPTFAGGVLVSTWQGTTVLRGDGEIDPIVAGDYFTDLRFEAAKPHGSGWMAINSGGVAMITPSSSEPLAVPVGSLAWMREGPIENAGYVGLLAFENETYRVLTIIPPDIPQSSYVRQGGEEPRSNEETTSSWEVIIFVISGMTAALEQRIPIADEVHSITWGRSASEELLLAYVTQLPGGSTSSKLWDGSAWAPLGDEGFSATDFHLLPNGMSIVVGLKEQGDLGSFIGYTVDQGSVQELNWTDPPAFLSGAKTASVVLSTGKRLLAIGSHPQEGDLYGVVLPLE